MHEHSIARRLIRLVESSYNYPDSQTIVAINVEVGTLSGVEPALLLSAFAMERESTVCEAAELNIQAIPMVGSCHDCQTEQPIREFNFRCQTCNQPLRLITGDKLELISITMEQGPQSLPMTSRQGADGFWMRDSPSSVARATTHRPEADG